MKLARLLSLLLLLALPGAVQAQFTFTTNNGALTITAYTGSGGNVIIPGTTNGLPVTSIAGAAFESCTSLTSVTIPDSVTSIGNGAFYYCSSLRTITVDALNSFYSSVDGVLFDESTNTLIAYPEGNAGPYTIPDSVTSIGYGAFCYCASLSGIEIGNSVTNIGHSAFFGCSSLTSLVIPNNVISIGSGAFDWCSGLTNITIGSGVTSIGSLAFQYCTNLTSLIIPNNVASISDSAFAWCASLTNATIGNSVTNIGNWDFWSCPSLATVTIGSNVVSLGSDTFVESPNLTGVYFQGNAPGPGTDSTVFSGDTNATVYYLSGTTGWGTTFDGRPTALWLPQAQTSDGSFGVLTNQFGFNINWASGQAVVVETCTNLANPIWTPLQTNTLTSSLCYFSDPNWTNYPARFYRLRSP
jgi:hypothetical protein